jgi:Ca2+/Na+ antiporter
MKNKNIKEIVISIFLIIIALLILNPLNFWMPDMMVLTMLAGIFVLFGIYASFVIREKADDEREEFHRMLAGRNAFLAGSAILIIAMIVEAYTYMIDKWLVVALIVMILVKILTRFWTDKNC